jgi:isoquinoline 1-oxidoreductase beta subunit
MSKRSASSMNRRNFLRLTGLTGAALTIGYYLPALAKTGPTVLTGAQAAAEGIDLTAWVRIDQSGLVTIFSHRAEMGQGAYQSIPQIVAEELEVDLNKIRVEFAKGHPSRYGSQITGGSSTVRGSFKALLNAGATAREMLIAAAADNWKVSVGECYASEGYVYHRSTGRKAGYGELVEKASTMKPPAHVPLKARKDYKYIGKDVARLDNPDKINGKAVFGIDFTVPGLRYASVERSARFHGRIKSFNDKKARAVKGVLDVIKVQMPVFAGTREGVAVIADNTWAALKARKLLEIEWDDSGIEPVNTETLIERMRNDLAKPGLPQKALGDAPRLIASAEKKIELVYETPYQSHSAMEPLNCTAHYTDGKIQVWGPIQGPDWVQSDLSARFNVPVENVEVNMTFLGGGFGRKAFTDYPAEAVAISKAIKAPVQVIWTREDDMTQGPFRPGVVYGCRAVLEKARIKALEIKLAGQNMDHQWSPNPDKLDYNRSTTEGWLEPLFEGIPHYRFSDQPTESPIPVMWWRSVYSSTNSFAFESFLDELAHAAGKDPIEFRKNHISPDHERYHKLMDKLKEVTGWDKRSKGYGVAFAECFGSIIGEVVQVSPKGEQGVKVDKVTVVIDCGWYVNPTIIRQQVEGSVIMALGAATVHATNFKDGKAVETNFHQYRLSRIQDTPEIEVVIMENDEKAGGVGEPSLPPLAPALCNAIFDLTGKRIRKLPFSLNNLA